MQAFRCLTSSLSLSLLVVYINVFMASGRFETFAERTAAAASRSVLRVTPEFARLDAQEVASVATSFDEGARDGPGRLWAGIPPSAEVFIQRAQFRERRYFREPVNVEDMTLVYGFPEFVWIILVAVLVVVIFSAIVALAMCLARQLRSPESDDVRDVFIEPDLKPSKGEKLSPQQGRRAPMEQRQPQPEVAPAPAAAAPARPTEAAPQEPPPANPAAGVPMSDDNTNDAALLARPAGEQLPPAQSQPPSQQGGAAGGAARGRPQFQRIPMGMASRTPSEDGLQPRTVQPRAGQLDSTSSSLADTMPARAAAPDSAGSVPMSARGNTGEFFPASARSQQSQASDGRISDYADQIDRLINELDQEVRKGRPRLPHGLQQDPKKGGGKGRGSDQPRSPAIPALSLPAASSAEAGASVGATGQ